MMELFWKKSWRLLIVFNYFLKKNPTIEVWHGPKYCFMKKLLRSSTEQSRSVTHKQVLDKDLSILWDLCNKFSPEQIE